MRAPTTYASPQRRRSLPAPAADTNDSARRLATELGSLAPATSRFTSLGRDHAPRPEPLAHVAVVLFAAELCVRQDHVERSDLSGGIGQRAQHRQTVVGTRAGCLRQQDLVLRADHDEPLQSPAPKHRLTAAVVCALDVETRSPDRARSQPPVASTATVGAGLSCLARPVSDERRRSPPGLARRAAAGNGGV